MPINPIEESKVDAAPLSNASNIQSDSTVVEGPEMRAIEDQVVSPIQAIAIQEANSLPHRQLSLSASFERADRNNKEILLSATTLSIAQAAIVIARAIPNPVFNMTFGFGPAWQYIVAGNNQQVGITEELQVAGKRTKKTAVARASFLQTAFQIEATRFSVHNRVRRAYSEMVAATAYADLVETQRSIATNLLEIAEKRYLAGKSPGSQVLQAKLAVMQFNTQRNQSLGRLIQDSARMAQLLGEIPGHEEMFDVNDTALFRLLVGESNLVPEPSRDVPPMEELLPTAWSQRNDLRAAIQQAYVGRKSLTLAKAQRFPDPFVGFNYLFSTYKSHQPLYFTGSVPYQPGYLYTLQQEVPLFYHYQGQVAQAKANLDEQLKQVDLQRSRIASGIVTAYESLIVTKANIKKFKEDLLPAGEKVAHMSRRAYELGQTDLATAILAQQQYQQLRSQYFDAVVSYQNAWADLEVAVGVPLK